MVANDKQIGGNHYRKNYQHWDFVVDSRLHYLIACATKYVSRWREKNGIQDLQKAEHYISKAMEKGILVPPVVSVYINKFCRQLHPEDAAVIRAICDEEFEDAIIAITELIDEAGPIMFQD